MSQLGQETPVGQIASGLRALWEADHAKARAALMNLVIYAEDGTPLEEMAADAQTIAAEQACRALVIRNEPCPAGDERPPRAWITAHCRLGGAGGGQICCEQVAFDLCAHDNNQLRNIVFAHLDSDLPLVFWWRGELSDNFEPRLYSRFDRLVIDSDPWPDPAAGIARAADPEGAAHYVLHDVAWSRTHALRLAIADCFDDPGALGALAATERITITHSPHHPGAADLLARWFARGLRWDDLQAASIIDRQAAPGTPVSRVEIACGDDRFEVSDDGATIACAASQAGRETRRILPAAPSSPAATVGELLARGGRNELYLKLGLG